MIDIPTSHRDLLERALFAHWATSRPDGAAQVNPMWFLWDGKNVLFTCTTTRQKYRNIAADPRVALSINDPEQPYRYLEVRGVVARIDPDGDAAFFATLADRYGMSLDGPPPDAADRVVVVVEPTAFSLQ